jgi:sulfite exporter TauE/SafE
VAAYHLGRTTAYTALGAVAGATGGIVAGNGLGRGLGVVAAIALLIQAVWQWRGHAGGAWPWLTRMIGAAGRWMRRHPVAGPGLFGAMTGLLPCGLIYGALTAAVGQGSAR